MIPGRIVLSLVFAAFVVGRTHGSAPTPPAVGADPRVGPMQDVPVTRQIDLTITEGTSMAAAASCGYLPLRRSDTGCATCKPCSSANRFTGLAASFMPRPAGRSGCVSTSGTGNPAA